MAPAASEGHGQRLTPASDVLGPATLQPGMPVNVVDFLNISSLIHWEDPVQKSTTFIRNSPSQRCASAIVMVRPIVLFCQSQRFAARGLIRNPEPFRERQKDSSAYVKIKIGRPLSVSCSRSRCSFTASCLGGASKRRFGQNDKTRRNDDVRCG